MKTAIISDIHGNYPALKAVMEDAKRHKIDSYIFAGDYIFDLPYANEVTELIRSLENAYVIQGNKEGYLENLWSEDQTSWNIDQIGAIHQTFRELTEKNLQYLMNLPKTCLIPRGKGNIFVTHNIKGFPAGGKQPGFSSSQYAKDRKEKNFTNDEFSEKVRAVLNCEQNREIVGTLDASVIIVGHSHLQWHGYCGDKLILNPGSCGQPLDFNSHAAYTILEENESGMHICEKRVPYDIEQVIVYSRTTPVYKKGQIWCELVILSLRKGKDIFSDFFKIAQEIAKERNETGTFYSNETWHITSERYKGVEKDYFLP